MNQHCSCHGRLRCSGVCCAVAPPVLAAGASKGPVKMGGPELTVAALSAEKLQILRGPPKFGEEIFTTGGGNIFDYNPTGSCFVHCREKQISFYTDTDSDPVRNRAQAEVKRLSFSPTGAQPFRVRARLRTLALRHRPAAFGKAALVHILT